MSNLQDITHLHTQAFHLSSIGRSESAPAILSTSSITGVQPMTRTDNEESSQNQHGNNLSTLREKPSIDDIKPDLPRFFSAFAIGAGNNWRDSYEAIGH
ncbi:hypothetical protein L486_05666 [Kwoniella mangroviensis CBS 10435]|uniref:Uncharacterized protein n=1 Tax=Kwoniella mangroviensis CBS 10435 TaxID=1331196 RepID=A0A1B9IN02_9TREE|nr:hypothetical protein L486_05666 [Kwoniella mangroviensis CBS 10435]